MANETKVIKIDIDILKAIESIQQLRKELDSLTSATNKNNNAKNQEKALTKEVSSAYQKLKNDYELASQKAKDLAAAQGLQSQATKDAINSANKLGAQLNDINKTLAQGKTDIMAFSSVMTIMPGTIGQLGFAFQRLGVIMNTLFINPVFKMVAIIGGLIGSFVLLAKQSMEFSFEMAKVKAITSATNEEFEKLRETAIKTGATTMKTAVEVAQLQVELGKLGFAAEDINKMTYAITQLSVATTEDLASSAEVAGGVIRAFGLQASDINRVVDVMSKSFMTSALNLQRFRLALTYVGPVARQAGLSLEETVSILAVLSNNLVVGSKSGTAIRRIIVELGNYAGGLTEKIKKLSQEHFTLADAEDEVGKYAMTALTALVQNADLLPKYTESMKNASGATDEMARIMGDTLTGDIIFAKSAWEAFLLQIENGEGIIARMARFFVQIWIGFINDLRNIGIYYEKYLVWLENEWIKFGYNIKAVFVSIIEPMIFAGKLIENFVKDGNVDNLSESFKKMKENIKGAWDSNNWKSAIALRNEVRKTEESIRSLNKTISPEEQQAFNDRQNALKKYIYTQKDILKKEYDDNLIELKEYLKKEAITQDEYNKASIRLKNQYNEEIHKLDKKKQNNTQLNRVEDDIQNMYARMRKTIYDENNKLVQSGMVDEKATKQITDFIEDVVDGRLKGEQAIFKIKEMFRQYAIEDADMELAIAQNLGNADYDLTIQLLDAKRDAELLYAQDGAKITEYYNSIKQKMNTEMINSQLSSYASMFGSLSSMLEENSVGQKIASTAQATINTYLGATAAYAQTPGDVITKSLAAAAAVASGLASVYKIWQVDTDVPENNSAQSAKVTSTSSEKFHTGTYRPASQTEEREITRTLLTTERVLSPTQTGIFDNILSRMQSYGGSGTITNGVGVQAYLQEAMFERAMTKAMMKLPAPRIGWDEFSNQAQRQAQLRANRALK